MTTLLYDGSWNGLLSCIFEVYERRITDPCAVKEYTHQPAFFYEEVHVEADEKKASRVLAGLRKRLTERGLNEFYACYLSGLPESDNLLLTYARLIFDGQADERAFATDAILKVSQIAKMVFRESHRMKGLVRFKLTTDGFYYAGIEPDFDVLPLIKVHFKKRYADQKWLIYDLKRQYGIYYDLTAVSEVTFESAIQTTHPEGNNVFNESEIEYESLWRQYYASTGIASRKNSKLHLRHVPKRYWKHLTEEIL